MQMFEGSSENIMGNGKKFNRRRSSSSVLTTQTWRRTSSADVNKRNAEKDRQALLGSPGNAQPRPSSSNSPHGRQKEERACWMTPLKEAWQGSSRDVSRRVSVPAFQPTSTTLCDMGLCHHDHRRIKSARKDREQTMTEMKRSYRDLALIMKRKAAWDKEAQLNRGYRVSEYGCLDPTSITIAKGAQTPSLQPPQSHAPPQQVAQGCPMNSDIRLLKRRPSMQIRELLERTKADQTMVQKYETQQERKRSLDQQSAKADIDKLQSRLQNEKST